MPNDWTRKDLDLGQDLGADPASTILRDNFRRWAAEARRQREAREEFAAHFKVPLATVPWAEHPPTTLEALAGLMDVSDGLPDHAMVIPPQIGVARPIREASCGSPPLPMTSLLGSAFWKRRSQRGGSADNSQRRGRRRMTSVRAVARDRLLTGALIGLVLFSMAFIWFVRYAQSVEAQDARVVTAVTRSDRTQPPAEHLRRSAR